MYQEFDLLGEQLVAAHAFRESGFDPALTVRDAITDANVPAGEMFNREGSRWFMRGDSLPGHLAIKAIAVDRDGIYLETAPLDEEKVSAIIKDKMFALAYHHTKGLVIDTSTGKPLVVLTTHIQKPTGALKELASRIMWTIPGGASEVRTEAVIRFADAIFSGDAFNLDGDSEEPPPETATLPRAQEMTLKLQLGLEQRLSLEQRPLLSLSPEVRGEQRQELQLQIRQMLSIEHRLLHLTHEELLAYAAKDASLEGQKRMQKIFQFVLAGKVKRAMADQHPDMTWRDARRIARKLVNGA